MVRVEPRCTGVVATPDVRAVPAVHVCRGSARTMIGVSYRAADSRVLVPNFKPTLNTLTGPGIVGVRSNEVPLVVYFPLIITDVTKFDWFVRIERRVVVGGIVFEVSRRLLVSPEKLKLVALGWVVAGRLEASLDPVLTAGGGAVSEGPFSSLANA
jgi:hypothetical protein